MSSPKLAECPSCGYSAGIYLAPKNERTAATLVRCLSCYAQAPLSRWLDSRKSPELVVRLRRSRARA